MCSLLLAPVHHESVGICSHLEPLMALWVGRMETMYPGQSTVDIHHWKIWCLSSSRSQFSPFPPLQYTVSVLDSRDGVECRGGCLPVSRLHTSAALMLAQFFVTSILCFSSRLQKFLKKLRDSCKRTNSVPYPTPCTKINSKWVTDLNVRSTAVKLLEEKTQSQSFNYIGFGDDFLDMMPKA